MKRYRKKKRVSVAGVLASILLFAGGVTAVAMGGMGLVSTQSAPPQSLQAEIPETEPATEPTAAALPEVDHPVHYPKSSDVRSRDNYMIRDGNTEVAEQVVASMGSAKLTNGELQIYYRAALDSYMSTNPDGIPDPAQPCPLTDGSLTWQQYFLQKAVADWQLVQAMLDAAQQPQLITEEEYRPDPEGLNPMHADNITPDLPVNDFLYCDKPCYQPNSMHQAYLDELETVLTEKAKVLGCSSLEEYCEKLYGQSVTAGDLLKAAKDYNTAYMYFTERSFYLEVSSEDVSAYIQQHSAELPAASEYTVDVRHILLLPEGAKPDKNGKVDASEAAWNKAKTRAETMLQEWLWDYPTAMTEHGKDYNFSRWAFRNSADGGSNLNGGLYSNVHKGQLIRELDEWCFDSARKVEDYTVLRSDLGYHLVMISKINRAQENAAREALLLQAEEKDWQSFLEGKTLDVNYGEAAIWVNQTDSGISLDDILYPDIAHERFPEAMVYLQQDYYYVRFGGALVGKGGCGVTTMAMLATYMTDKLYTPAMIAKAYPRFNAGGGTDAMIFQYVPAELGFQTEDIVYDVSLAAEALMANKRVVSLQYPGHFTKAGHYLLLQKYYPENDTFQIRDSNVFNYGSLSGHKVDYFTRDNLQTGGAYYVIFPEKVTHIPACTRCGDGKERLMIQDYLCVRCTEALERRGNFMSVLENG